MNPQIQDALEWMPEAVLVVDSLGVVIFANHRVEALFGYTPSEIVARPIESLLPERSHGRRRDGSEFPAEVTSSPVRDAGQVMRLAVVRDVSDRRRIEQEFIAARELAERANLAKSRFLATASHDLRQPLQALSLLNGALRRLVTDSDVAEALMHQEQAIATMSQLVNALLDISKLESGKVRPVPSNFAIESLFNELRQEFATLAAHKGLLLQVEAGSDMVRSDPALLGQILRNLLSNAIKYTRHGRVLLRCTSGSGVCCIDVLDTGIGIPADQIAYIYDEFFQVGASPTEPREGYGLGLSIVSRLVKLLGLTLSVESEPGRGTRFRLQLPASKAHLQHLSGSASTHSMARPPEPAERVRDCVAR